MSWSWGTSCRGHYILGASWPVTFFSTNIDLCFKTIVLCFENCLLCLQMWATILQKWLQISLGIYILHIQANKGSMKLTFKLSTSLESTHTTLKTQDFQCFTLAHIAHTYWFTIEFASQIFRNWKELEQCWSLDKAKSFVILKRPWSMPITWIIINKKAGNIGGEAKHMLVDF